MVACFSSFIQPVEFCQLWGLKGGLKAPQVTLYQLRQNPLTNITSMVKIQMPLE